MSTRKEMTDPSNLRIACVPCNVKKGNTPYEDFIKNK